MRVLRSWALRKGLRFLCDLVVDFPSQDVILAVLDLYWLKKNDVDIFCNWIYGLRFISLQFHMWPNTLFTQTSLIGFHVNNKPDLLAANNSWCCLTMQFNIFIVCPDFFSEDVSTETLYLFLCICYNIWDIILDSVLESHCYTCSGECYKKAIFIIDIMLIFLDNQKTLISYQYSPWRENLRN